MLRDPQAYAAELACRVDFEWKNNFHFIRRHFVIFQLFFLFFFTTAELFFFFLFLHQKLPERNGENSQNMTTTMIFELKCIFKSRERESGDSMSASPMSCSIDYAFFARFFFLHFFFGTKRAKSARRKNLLKISSRCAQ